MFGAALSFAGGLLANRSARRDAQANREFQADMSDTSYQRGMEDMRKAGLNPILAYKQGGASAPSGSTASQQNPAAGVPAAISSAVQMKRVQAEIDNLESNAALTTERARTEQAQQGLINANTALTSERTNTQGHLTEQEKIRIQTAIATLGKTRMDSLVAEAAADRAILQGNIDRSDVGQFIGWLHRANELGLGPQQVLGLLRGRKPGGAFPSLRSGAPYKPGGKSIADRYRSKNPTLVE